MHVASNGWSPRLFWLWILYNSVAFVVVLTAVAGAFVDQRGCAASVFEQPAPRLGKRSAGGEDLLLQ